MSVKNSNFCKKSTLCKKTNVQKMVNWIFVAAQASNEHFVRCDSKSEKLLRVDVTIY